MIFGDSDALVNIGKVAADFFGADKVPAFAKSDGSDDNASEFCDGFGKEVDAFFAAGDMDDNAEKSADAKVHDEGNWHNPNGFIGDKAEGEKDKNSDEGLEIIYDRSDGVAKDIQKASLASRDAKRRKSISDKSEAAEATSRNGVINEI